MTSMWNRASKLVLIRIKMTFLREKDGIKFLQNEISSSRFTERVDRKVKLGIQMIIVAEDSLERTLAENYDSQKVE